MIKKLQQSLGLEFLKSVVTDYDAGEGEEGFAAVSVFVVADFQPSIVVNGRDGLLDDIAIFAETTAVRRSPLGDPRRDAEPEQDGRVRRGVISPVGEELFGLAVEAAVVGEWAGGDHGKH